MQTETHWKAVPFPERGTALRSTLDMCVACVGCVATRGWHVLRWQTAPHHDCLLTLPSEVQSDRRCTRPGERDSLRLRRRSSMNLAKCPRTTPLLSSPNADYLHLPHPTLVPQTAARSTPAAATASSLRFACRTAIHDRLESICHRLALNSHPPTSWCPAIQSGPCGFALHRCTRRKQPGSQLAGCSISSAKPQCKTTGRGLQMACLN
jgi:hypothetical protein